ncbi:hypothetical protein SLA2020_380510 [Shorea laevis]|jgi:hypothetical protein
MSSEAPLSATGEDISGQLYVVLESAGANSGEDVSARGCAGLAKGGVNQIADREEGEVVGHSVENVEMTSEVGSIGKERASLVQEPSGSNRKQGSKPAHP